RESARCSVRSWQAATINAAASPSINSWSTRRTDSQIRSTPSPARNASSSSDTADSDRAIGCFSSWCALGGTHRESRRWPHYVVDPPAAPKPHHLTGRSLRVLRQRLRRGSGGAGSAPGGEGIERDLQVLVDATVSLITERRVSQPWGLAGGEPGAVGENWLLPGGDESKAERLPDKCTIQLKVGDVLRMLRSEEHTSELQSRE